MTPEKIAELREKIRDGRIIILTQGNIADVSDLLLLLDECEKTRAGAGPRIFPGVGQNPTLGGPSPGSSDDERALEYLYRWKRVFTSLGNGWTVEDENALAHIKSRLAAGSPRVTREQIVRLLDGWLGIYWSRPEEEIESVTKWLRDIGVEVVEP